MADPHFFKPPQPQSLADLAKLVGGVCQGNHTLLITDVAPMHMAQASQLTFLSNTKYANLLAQSQAGACVIELAMMPYAPMHMALIVVPDAYVAYAQIAQIFYPEFAWQKAFVAANAFIHKTASIGDNCIIDHNVYVGRGAQIGKNCWLKPNTVIGPNVVVGDNAIIGSNCSLSHCILGHHVRLLPGVRVGQDGFGFAATSQGVIDIPQLGRVLIGNHVLVGANTTIDRGAGPDTEIGDFTRIDNLVQIAHNVKIGKGCILAAQVGVAGSSVIEDYAMLGGQVGISGHLTIGSRAKIAAQSGVTKNVPANAEMMGYPAMPMKAFLRQVITLAQLAKSRHNGAK